MKRNIFVVGLHPFHREMLQEVRGVDDYAFHGLLDFDEIINPRRYPFDDMLRRAEDQLRRFPERVDAVITHWDFPGSTLVPILASRLGLRAASLESVLKCEHKYWARREQQQVVPDLIPGFEAVDPFDDAALSNPPLPFPFWIKPVKSFASHLGFRVDDLQGYRQAIRALRQQIRRIGDAFDEVLAHADVPDDIARIGGSWCIAEEIIGGRQCGIEGYVHDGRVAVHGVIDCVKDADNQSFTRFEYPSAWPEHVQRRMADAAERLLTHVGYDDSAFGIEFFWDEDTDRLSLLEVNTRISQSHSDQFIRVRGVSNHQVAIDVALGQEPRLGGYRGPDACAAKFMLRKYHDAEVTRVPTPEELARAEARVPGAHVHVLVEEGTRLSELRDQDSYSYEIAHVYLGADSQDALLDRYEQVVDALPFGFSDGRAPEPVQFVKVAY